VCCADDCEISSVYSDPHVSLCVEYFAGYLLEQSLSVDNLFVFVLVFRYFATPPESQKTVLSYGIGTAAILRLVLIILGADAVEKWKPILLVFSGILLYSSFNLLLLYVYAPQMRKNTGKCGSIYEKDLFLLLQVGRR
jgi:predicted tellurium resistance membrane protein TerC